MINPMKHNQEHLEAAQQALDEKNKKLREEFDGKYDYKFKAVEDALKILSDNDIRCYIFASLPSLHYGEKEGVWQYNNHSKYIEYEGGKTTTASKAKTGMFNTMFLASFYSLIRSMFSTNIIPPEHLGMHIISQNNQAVEWLQNGTLPTDVQKLMDDENS